MSESVSETREYRIELSDIRGVGPKTLDVLEKAGITHIKETHLLRHMSGHSGSIVRDNVGSDTQKHLRAVGEAMNGTSPHYVKSKHLTGEWDSYGVRIDVPPERETTDEGDEESPTPSDSDVKDAIRRIQSEYGEEYGEQISFEGDVGRVTSESLPVGIVQSILRYQHDPDRVLHQGDMDDDVKRTIVAFVESLD